MKAKIIVIVGPTASGKSDLAVRIAKEFNGEVISADSRQVYNGLDIGTGKITDQEMNGIRHHLLDIADPKDQFTVTQWRVLAKTAISDILNRGKLPIICGGTGFYISTLIEDISLPDVPANQILRNELANKTAQELFDILQKINPEKASSLNHSDKNNPRRLIRAIEIGGLTSEVRSPIRESSYDSLWIGTKLSTEELHKNVSDRLEKRINQGMIDEVKNLQQQGLSWERMEELGLEYRYVSEYLQGKMSLEKMREKLIIEINKYAKRQMTWFKRNKDINWFIPSDFETIKDNLKKFLL